MTEPSTLIFIRHAETALAGTFCGSSDPPLNGIGCAQLAPLLNSLKPCPIDIVYTSDLIRAQQTAQAIAEERGIQVITRPALREIHFGDWEGFTWDQIEQRDQQFAARWVSEFPTLATPNGEPIATFEQRVLTEIAALRQMPFANLAVVTHAGVLRVLLERFGHLARQHAWERSRDYCCTIRCTQRSSSESMTVHL